MLVQVYHYDISHRKYIKSWFYRQYYLVICCFMKYAHVAPVINGFEYGISASRMSIFIAQSAPVPSKITFYDIDEFKVNKWQTRWMAASMEYPKGIWHWIRYALSPIFKYPNCISWTNDLILNK